MVVEDRRGLRRIAFGLYIWYLGSQGLRKVERAVIYQLFVRYVEGSTGNEPTESL